ncbi:MAG: hypothetical protein JXA33_05920 [Anaerolineae bacterium]|nr:hypothetical protein [Anaerolineae bacterium]
MKKWTIWMMGLVVVLVLAFPAVTLAAGGPPAGRGRGSGEQQGNGIGQTGTVPVVTGTLTAEQEAALVDFWMDEYRALMTYQAVIAQFGEVQPFTSIVQAEQSHLAAVERIFSRYGLSVPATSVIDVPVFDSVEAACAAGVQAEVDNAALYDALLGGFTQSDILQVANNLRNASLNNHLPAFEACSSGEYIGSTGSGGVGYRGGAMDTTGSMGSGAPSGQGYGAATAPGTEYASRGNAQAPRLNMQNVDCPVFQD